MRAGEVAILPSQKLPFRMFRRPDPVPRRSEAARIPGVVLLPCPSRKLIVRIDCWLFTPLMPRYSMNFVLLEISL